MKRAKGRIGEPRDLWSTPSPEGYVRDDNSLIKTLPKNLKMDSPSAALDGETMGGNWVACHIWPMSRATDPWLNSFVPNLVWLPKPLDVLSDREGHPVQQLLRRTSLDYFSTQETAARSLVRELFAGLTPKPTAAASFEVRNTFKSNSSWSMRRWKKVEDVARILEALASGDVAPCRSGHSHYDGHVADLYVHADVPFHRCLLSVGIVDSPTRGCPMEPGGTNLRVPGDLRRRS